MNTLQVDKENYRKVVDRQNLLTQKLINLFPDDAELSQLTDIKSSRDVDKTKEDLRELIRGLDNPIFTKSSHDSFCRRQLDLLVEEAEIKKVIDISAYRKDAMAMKQKNFTIKSNRVLKGYNFFTKKYIDKPLEYEDDITPEIVEPLICYLPDSKILYLPGTLQSIVEFCRVHGLNKQKQLCQVLNIVIRQKIPTMIESSRPAYNENNGTKMFDQLISSINPRAEQAKLERALKSIVRETGEEISTTIEKMRSICLQIVKHKNPSINDVKLQDRLCTMIRMYLPAFISDKALPKFRAWKAAHLENYCEHPSLEEMMKKIQEFEALPGHALTGPKTNSQGQIDNEDLMAEMAGARNDDDDDDPNLSLYNVNGNFNRGRDKTVKPNYNQQNKQQHNNQGNNFGKNRSYSQSPKKFLSKSRSQSRERSQSKSRPNSPFHRNKSEVLPVENSYRTRSGNRIPSPNSGRMNILDFRNPAYKRCIMCRGSHDSKDCYQYFRPSKYPCQSCLKRTKELLYHDQRVCAYNQNTLFGERSGYQKPSRETAERNSDNNRKNAEKGYFKYKFNPSSTGNSTKNF